MASKLEKPYDQTVFLLQGGGALGAYQGGVCEALLEADLTPNWIIGTSIGAINSAIIAGNKPEHRIEKLKIFWDRIATPLPYIPTPNEYIPFLQYQKYLSALWTTLFGQTGFFKPRLTSPFLESDCYPNQISFYDCSELKETLEELVDFDLINQKKTRLTLGAVCVEDSAQVFFDNKKQTIGPEHVMASGALPPGFPAVNIDGKSYWDGGLKSNTPLYAVLEEKKPQKLLCILVHLFSYHQQIPTSMFEVMKRKKDIEFSSRYHQILEYFCKEHKLNYALHELFEAAKESNKALPNNIIKLGHLAHPTALNITRFHYRDNATDLWSKDFEFSAQSIKDRWEQGYKNVQKALKQPRKWLSPIPENKGVILHEF